MEKQATWWKPPRIVAKLITILADPHTVAQTMYTHDYNLKTKAYPAQAMYLCLQWIKDQVTR